MAENLGDAVLVVRADTSQLEAGFRQAEERARQAGAAAQEAFQAPVNSIAGLQAKLADLQQSFSVAEIGSTEFNKLKNQILAVEAALKTAGVAGNSFATLAAKLQGLQQILQTVDIGSQAFRNIEAEIKGIQQQLSAIGVSANSLQALNARLQELRQSLQKVDVGSQTFRNLQREIERTERTLSTIGVASNSIAGLSNKLAGLQQSFRSVEIGSREFRNLQREIQRTERELARVDQTLAGRLARGAKGFGSEALMALGVGGAAAGAGFVAGGFLKGSVDQAVELENVTRKLTVTLGPQGAAGAISFTRGISRELGLSFNTLVGTYSSFTAAATAANIPIEQQRQLFTSVSRAAQAYGLSNEQVGGTFLALQQVASKGTVSMEELRLQLAERLPVALSATAKGLGITQRDLIKLVESGRLTASQFFPALSRGLDDLTKSSVGLETASQKFQRFQNAWQKLQQSLGTNLLPAVTIAVDGLTKALEGPGEGQRLGLLGDQAKKTSEALQQISAKYNLTEEQARNIANQTISSFGRKDTFRETFGQVNLTDRELLLFLKQLNIEAAKFAEKNKDTVGPIKAQEAAIAAANEQARLRNQATQKTLDRELQRSKLLEREASAAARLEGSRRTPGLDEAGRARLEAELSLGEKVRALQISRLELAREQAKLPGVGDGKEGTQSFAKLAELQSQVRSSEIDVAAAQLEGSKAVADALRNQQERTRQLRLENQSAADRLQITRQQTALEAAAAQSQSQVSATAMLQLQQRATLAEKLRGLDAARGARATELARGAEADRVALRDITDRIARANADVRQSYADAGLALTANARSAAEALRGAQQNLQGIMRGGFEFLTSDLQQQQLERARASIQPLVNQGVIRTGIDISTPDRLFAVAGFAEQLVPAQKALQNAINENAAAARALAQKDWNVYVQVPGSSPTPVPIPRT